MMKKLLLLIVVSLNMSLFSFAQKVPEVGKFYDFTDENVKDFCWESDDPRCTDTVVPSEWRHESAVFLYFENYYEAVRIQQRGLALTYIAHYRLKLLDNSAVERFSEIYYSQDPHGTIPFQTALLYRKKSFLGIKIIKPDGKEIALDNEDFINDEDGGKKLAVPNLEVGDIIDYYQYTWDYSKTSESYMLIDKFIIGGQYPVKHFKYQLITSRDWNVMFTTGANGPDIAEKKIGKKHYQFIIEDSDFPSSDKVMWSMPYNTNAYVKVYLKYKKSALAEKGNSKTYRTTKVSYDEIKAEFSKYYEKSSAASNDYSSFLKFLKKNGKSNLTREQKLEEYYYFLRHRFINQHYIYDLYYQGGSVTSVMYNTYAFGAQRIRYDDNGIRYVSPMVFTGHIIYALNEMNIRYDLIVVPRRGDGPVSDVLSVHEMDYVIKARLKNPLYFFKPSVFTSFNQLPSSIEGVDGFALYSPDKKIKNIGVKKITLPVSDAGSNSTSHEIEIKFNDEDPLKLDIITRITYNGLSRVLKKDLYTDIFTMIWDENEYYKTKQWGSEEESKEKVQIQMDEFMASKEKERKESFEKLAKYLYNTDEVDLIKYENLNTGNQAGESDFQISFNCIADELVKRVGNNYIIRAGQIIGGQIIIDEQNQERDVDIQMSYARSFNYVVNIAIPEGYEVKGLENFNLNIDNATGSVISSAKEKDGVVSIHFSKTYKHNTEKAEDWDLMKDFLTPASLYPSKELLLKKL